MPKQTPPHRFVPYAIDGTPAVAAWDWDLVSGVVSYSAAVAHLLGIPVEALGQDAGWWLSRIVPEDRARVRMDVGRAILRGQRWTCAYRVRREDGTTLWIKGRGFVAKDSDRVVRALAVLDVASADAAHPATEPDTPRTRDSRSAEEFHTFVNSLPQLAWTADAHGWIDFYNQRWYEYTGTTPEEMEGWGWISVHDANDLPRMLRIWRNALETGQPWEDEFRLRRGFDGALRWHLSRAQPVRDAMGRIVRWFGTNTDIHDQKLAAEEYARLLAREKQSRMAAEAANRAKDEFLAIVSHELRSPLNAMLGWTHLLRIGAMDASAAQKAVERIENNARQQAKLIEDLLDASRIISGKLGVELEPTDSVAAIRATVESLKPVAQERGVLLSLQEDTPRAIVCGSAARLQQIVGNLVGNAIKFTPASRPVVVRVSCEESQAVIVVRDEGEGIAPEFLPRLFHRFTQADTTSTRRYGGLGLGLAIVRQLVELHRGEVTANSQGLGRGAVFTVRLPLFHEAQHQPAQESTALASDVPASLAGIKVLAVDDEASAREVLSALLLSSGASVTLASSAHEALRAFKLDRPDVVLCDIAMPEVDGYQLVSKVRSFADTAACTTPIIAVTAYASLQDRERALRLGFDRHLPKPINPARLTREILEVVRRQFLPREAHAHGGE